MNIEIRGGGFNNKGAELMVDSILKAFENTGKHKFILSQSTRDMFEERARRILFTKISYWKFGIQWGNIINILPKKILDALGIVLNSEIDLILDCSGFALSDQWDHSFFVRCYKEFRSAKKRGTQIILLPQALGPFNSKKNRILIVKILKLCDLVFIRDRQSRQYVKDVYNGNNLFSAPDFTSTVKTESFYLNLKNYVLLIPNRRMLDRGNVTEDNYINFFKLCIQIIHSRNLTPGILVHENQDISLANKISELFSIGLFKTKQAVDLKKIIGSVFCVIGSRFHGIVSALNQDVPAIATSWSHKYIALFEEYGLQNFVIDDLDDIASVKSILETVFSNREEISRGLFERNKILNQNTETMWNQVFDLLKLDKNCENCLYPYE